VATGDLNADGKPNLAIGNKREAFVFLQETRSDCQKLSRGLQAFPNWGELRRAAKPLQQPKFPDGITLTHQFSC